MQSLDSIREEIDQIDQQILNLVSQRLAYMPAVAEYKRKKGLQTRDTGREKEMMV
ncbi:MAG: chorismate mutase, partial [Nanoarchaeota archaeon]